jgi:hypothetical protein
MIAGHWWPYGASSRVSWLVDPDGAAAGAVALPMTAGRTNFGAFGSAVCSSGIVKLARGLSNKQIAERLVITPKTAGNHVEHIYATIGISSRAAAAMFAVQHGLLPEDKVAALTPPRAAWLSMACANHFNDRGVADADKAYSPELPL